MVRTELAPKDIRQLFICHKDLFYRTYADWPEAEQVFVAHFPEREYLMDKAGVRDALFGHVPALQVPLLPRKPSTPARGPVTGPWGAVKRR